MTSFYKLRSFRVASYAAGQDGFSVLIKLNFLQFLKFCGSILKFLLGYPNKVSLLTLLRWGFPPPSPLVPISDLGLGNVQGLSEFSLFDQPGEFPGTGHVAAFPDVDEVGLLADAERLQPGEVAHARRLREGFFPGFDVLDGLGDGPDVIRSRAATSAHDVDESGLREFPD